MGDPYALAWDFHLNTSRHAFNTLAPGTIELTPPFLEYPQAPLIGLPRVPLPEASLRVAIEGRSSCRSFSDAWLSLEQVAALMTSAYGVIGEAEMGDLQLLERPVPSGGGLYPLECFLLARRLESISPGVYHYVPLHHGLEQLSTALPSERMISDLFLDQPYAARAPLIVVFCAVLSRSMEKYGDRGYRYILLEAGHAAQNATLVATALGLGSLSLGGFFDRDLAALLQVAWPDTVPLYALAVGASRSAERRTRRQPA